MLLMPLAAFSQQGPRPFGSVSINELRNENYASDTSSAVILFDKGEVVVEPNSTSRTVSKRHVRIKILRPEALDVWGNFKYYINIEGQMKVQGATYNLNNGVIQKSDLEESSVMRGKHNKYTEIVNIAFPNVRVGSVVEFSYVIKYPDLYAPSWKFQYAIPVRWSEYAISIPVEKIVYHFSGSIQPAQHEVKYNGEYHHWVLKDIPAFKPEPFMPDPDVYTSGVDFATHFTSWEGVYHELTLSEKFGPVVHQYKYLKNTVEELTSGMTDERQKIKIISDYVKHHVKFNGVDNYLGTNLTDLLQEKSGSSGDINLLLASLLEKAGLQVSMVLLSTRDNGFLVEDLPVLHQFNYVVCEVATKAGHILVDATEELLPYDILPPRCLNHKGFIVATGQFGWVGVAPSQREKITMDVNVTLSANGALQGKVKTYKDGYAAFNERKRFLKEATGNEYKIDLGNKLCKIAQPDVQNMKVLGKPVEQSCDVSMDEFAVLSNDLIYFNPHIFLREEFNPFTAENRTYPVDLGKLVDHTVVYTIALPVGYKVDELPANKVFALPDNSAKCTISFSLVGEKITVITKVQINKMLFQPLEYPGLKEFYAKLVAKKSENIVLKKTNKSDEL